MLHWSYNRTLYIVHWKTLNNSLTNNNSLKTCSKNVIINLCGISDYYNFEKNIQNSKTFCEISRKIKFDMKTIYQLQKNLIVKISQILVTL